jgi:hypothetical protein
MIKCGMIRPQNTPQATASIRNTAALVLWVIAAMLPTLLRADASPNVLLWDTSAVEDRTAWKAVPPDLLALEANPATARADPGYYGREYAFKGDAIVENASLTAVFLSAKGRVVIYTKGNSAGPGDGAQYKPGLGAKLADITPLEEKAKPMTITRLTILHNTGAGLALEAGFSAEGATEVSETFVFDNTAIVEIKPAQNSKGIGISSPVEYGIVPGFIGDDLIYRAADYPAATALSIPSENFILGLLRGEENELVMTWPKGKQQITLQTANEQSGERLIESIDFANDGQSLYLSSLSAPGIWHREPLKPAYLEKDVTIEWKRPFPAKWKTQLVEAGVRSTFNFKDAKQDIWRGVPGNYTYPVWFDGDAANYHLGKKVPPKGESLIYFLEPQDTPLAVSTPVGILEATLGRSTSDSIVDLDGRTLSTHHRRGAEGVRRACTCGCTEAIQKVFEARDEVARKDYVAGAVDDMIYFVHRHVERINHYREFVGELIPFLETDETAEPDLKPYLENLIQIARQIPQEYTNQEENMKSFAYADDLARQTLALTTREDPNNLKTYTDLLDAWRGMGGAQDYVLAQCHAITRKLCQEAGYGCATQPKAVELAKEIRTRCRQCLRNPDGYEIWADY